MLRENRVGIGLWNVIIVEFKIQFLISYLTDYLIDNIFENLRGIISGTISRDKAESVVDYRTGYIVGLYQITRKNVKF